MWELYYKIEIGVPQTMYNYKDFLSDDLSKMLRENFLEYRVLGQHGTIEHNNGKGSLFDLGPLTAKTQEGETMAWFRTIMRPFVQNKGA